MARTTAEIDGDSSGLVGALDKGAKAMDGVRDDARKLSDQLREVADDADKFAGAMVQKIGGPGAIKALAGIGAAVGVAKAGVEAFLGSSEALFRSYGEQGQKVWDETEKSLFAIKGAFAEAVLGGGSVEEMGARLKSIFEGVKTVLDALLTPVKAVAEGLWSIARASSSVTDAKSRALEIDNKYAAAISAVSKATDTEKESLDNLLISLGDVYRSKQETAALEYDRTLAELDAALANNREAREFRANAAADLAAAKAVEAEIKAALEGKMLQAMRDVKSPESSRRIAMLTYEERARELLEADQSFQAQLRVSTNAAREAAYRDMAVATQAELDKEAEILKRREIYVQKNEELKFLMANPPKAPKGGGVSSGVDPVEDARQKAVGVRFHFKMTALEITESINKAGVELAAKSAKNMDDVFALALSKVRAATEAAGAAAETAAEQKKAADEAAYHQWVGQNAKQVAIGIGSGKKLADIARAQIGAVISGLGDKALAEAGIMYAAGNVPGAVAMTAAGMAAYATAAVMGSTAKKAAASTPAAAPAAAPQNISYNLRVDAAFADGELVARQFARMQREAGRRGFAAAGAY